MNIIEFNGERLCSFYKKNDMNIGSTEDITDDEAFFVKSSLMDNHLNLDSPLDSNHEDEEYIFTPKRPRRLVKPKQDYIISDIEHKNLQKAFKESILEVRRNKSNEMTRNLSDQISSSIDDYESNSTISEEKIKLCIKQAARKFPSNFSFSSNSTRKNFKFKKKHNSEAPLIGDVPAFKKRQIVDTNDFIKYLILRGIDKDSSILQNLNHSKMIYDTSEFKSTIMPLTNFGELSSCSNDSYDYNIPTKSNSSFTTSIDSSEFVDLNKNDIISTEIQDSNINIEHPLCNNSLNLYCVSHSNTFAQPPYQESSSLQLHNHPVSNTSQNSIFTENESLNTINDQSVNKPALKLISSIIPIKNTKIVNNEFPLFNKISHILPKNQINHKKFPRICPKISNSIIEFKNFNSSPSVISSYQTLKMPINLMYLVPIRPLSTNGADLSSLQHGSKSSAFQLNEQISLNNKDVDSSKANIINSYSNQFSFYQSKINSSIPVTCTVKPIKSNMNINEIFINPKVKPESNLNKKNYIQPKTNNFLLSSASKYIDLSINSSQNININAPILESQNMNKNVLNINSCHVEISNISSHTTLISRQFNLEKTEISDFQINDSQKLLKKTNSSKFKINKSEECLNSFSNILDSEISDVKVFYPTENEFKNIFIYIHSIFKKNPHIGICKIIPPKELKIICNISDELKIPLHNQHIHKLRNRLCKTNIQLSEIHAHIISEGGSINGHPHLSGVEIDLPDLMHCVESLGGLKNVVLHNKWSNVISMMRLPRSSNERVNKIYDVYCQYLLSYNGLADKDKEKLRKQLYKNKERINIECLIQTQSKLLVDYYRISQKIFESHFKNAKPTIKIIEEEYNKIINEGRHHVVIQKAIYKPPYKANKSSKMPTLEKAIQIKGEISFYIDKISDIFLSKMNIGMLFATDCWRKDSLYMANINYLHTDSSVIWYSIDESNAELFKKVVVKLMPDHVHDNLNNWLTDDSLMISAQELVANKLNVSRVVQNNGEIIVTFPGSYFANVSCDYNIIECVRRIIDEDIWIEKAPLYFQMLEDSCRPSDANYIEFLLAASCSKTKKILNYILPILQDKIQEEFSLRKSLERLKIKTEIADRLIKYNTETLIDEMVQRQNINCCETCQQACYMSEVYEIKTDSYYCIKCGEKSASKKNISFFKFIIYFRKEELDIIQKHIQQNIFSNK